MKSQHHPYISRPILTHKSIDQVPAPREITLQSPTLLKSHPIGASMGILILYILIFLSECAPSPQTGQSHTAKNTEWIVHCPFYTGINLNHMGSDTKAPDDDIEVEDNALSGILLPPIDPTRTLRLIMQNTQYSLQLTNENANMMQLIQNPKQMETSVFVAISPNVKWHNPLNKVLFKCPFNLLYKQVYICSSSDLGFTQLHTLP
jgi:hypothetical protein